MKIADTPPWDEDINSFSFSLLYIFICNLSSALTTHPPPPPKKKQWKRTKTHLIYLKQNMGHMVQIELELQQVMDEDNKE